MTTHPTTQSKPSPTRYRIRTKDNRIKYAGTDRPSWFTLSKAREIVNYSQGENIVEHNSMEVLWEVF